MTATTRSKIAKANQEKQILEWKQEDYRTVLSNLVEFNSKYFGSSYSSLDVANLLKNLTAESSNTSYVTAVAGEAATSGSVFIQDIQSLAMAAKIQSTAAVSPPLSFTIDTENLNQLPGSSFHITLDGVTKAVTFADGTYSSAADVSTALTSLIDEAFGTGRINVSGADGKLSLAAENSLLRIADPETGGALAILGFTSADPATNRLDLDKTIGDYAGIFGDDQTFSFSINNKTFSFDPSASLNSVLSTINNSDADVKIAYSKVSDTFTMTAKETGSGSSIQMQDTEGAFLATIFAGSGNYTAGKDAVISINMDGSDDAGSLITITRSANTFTLDGITYTLKGMAANGGQEAVSVNTALDIEATVDKIVEFVDAYADLMNNLLILFIMLFAMSNIDAQKYQQLVEELSGTFSGSIQSEEVAAATESEVMAEIQQPADEGALNAAETDSDFTEVYELLKTKIADSGYDEQIILEKGDHFIQISFGDNVLFYPDSSVIRPEHLDVLKAIGNILYSVEANVETIEIAGHTADTDIRNGYFSWELSAARSIAVLACLVDDCQLPESKMSIAGFSRYHPIASNENESGRKLNRRVEIKITEIS